MKANLPSPGFSEKHSNVSKQTTSNLYVLYQRGSKPNPVGYDRG